MTNYVCMYDYTNYFYASWLNVDKRLELNTLNFIQKMKIGEAPEYLTKQLKYVGELNRTG